MVYSDIDCPRYDSFIIIWFEVEARGSRQNLRFLDPESNVLCLHSTHFFSTPLFPVSCFLPGKALLVRMPHAYLSHVILMV